MGNWTTVSTTGGAAPTVPAAPNIVSVEPLPGQASIVQYGMWANLTCYWVACLINLPTADSAYESGHLKKIHVIWSQAPAWSSLILYNVGDEAVYSGTTYVSLVADNAGNQPNTSPTYWQSGPSQPEELDVIYAPWASSPLTYVSSQLTQDVVALTGTLSFLTENDDGMVTRSDDAEGNPPCTVSLTIQAAAIASVTAIDAVSLRWYDSGGALHAVLSMITAGASNLPMNVTFWIDKGHGAGKEWQGWDLFASANPASPGGTLYIGAQRTDNGGINVTIPADYTTGGQYPPDSGENWTLYAAAGAYRAQDAFPTTFAVSTVVAMDSAAVNPYTIASVAATDGISLRWQDETTALHSVIVFIPVPSGYPTLVTAWIDKADGNGPQWQGWDYMSGAGDQLYIGLPTTANNAPPNEISRLGMQNSPTTGVQFPPTTGNQTWTLWVAPGGVRAEVPWADVVGAVSTTFTAISVASVLPSSVSAIQFVPNPLTGDVIDYTAADPGVYTWYLHELDWTQPTLTEDPNYWFSFPTVQYGHETSGTGTVTTVGEVSTLHSMGGTGFTSAMTGGGLVGGTGFVVHVNGVWNKIASYIGPSDVTLVNVATDGAGQPYIVWNRAPDNYGINEDAGGLWEGRRFANSGSLSPGNNSIPGTTIQLQLGFADAMPFTTNPDGSPGLDLTVRICIYAVSRMGTNQQGGVGTVTLMNGWPGGADHGDLFPVEQAAVLDLKRSNPLSLATPLILDPVTRQLTVGPNAITSDYLGDASVGATKMDENAITVANSQTVIEALALVDALIKSVGLSKLGAGTTVYNNTAVFTADVILSRGSGAPLLDIRNDGMFMFGLNVGNVGYTNYPYVAVQWSGILVSSGASGPSVTVNGASVNLWTVNGSQVNPFMTMSAGGGLVQKNGQAVSSLSSSGFVAQHVTTPYGSVVDAQVSVGATGVILYALIGGVLTPLITANSSGLTLAVGTHLTSPTITVTGSPFVINIDPINGLVVTTGTVSASLTSGALSCTAASVYNGGYQAGTFGIGNVSTNAAILATVMSSNAYISIFKAGVIAIYSYNGISIPSLPTSPGAHGSLWTDPSDSYRVKWVN